jgi:hypothetical protein
MIWGSHFGECEDGCLLDCNAVWTVTRLPTFQTSVLLPSSWRSSPWWWKAVRTSEALVNSYQPMRRYSPEDSHPHYLILISRCLYCFLSNYLHEAKADYRSTSQLIPRLLRVPAQSRMNAVYIVTPVCRMQFVIFNLCRIFYWRTLTLFSHFAVSCYILWVI